MPRGWNLDPVARKAPKRLASRYYQLKTGHAPIGTYLHRIGRRESPECQACKEPHETVRHVLFECRGRRTGRRALYRALEKAGVPLPTAAEESPEARLFAEPRATQGLLQFMAEANLFNDNERTAREAEISDLWGWDTLEEDEQEGQILLAISDLQNGRIQRVAQAARIYEIPRTTLQDRLNGIQQRSLVRANSHKLTQYEEESLVKWVLDLDRRGLPPQHSLVREMANYILSQHGKPQVGKNWITKLIKRRPEIDSKFARKYNYERAKCEDPKIIQEHFDRVQAAISEYGILPEDIFNFDETGFAMGLCATAKVITGSDRYAQPKLLQPGN
ncbi:conserved hypothetical protein [Talaromyces stipitatus ATCC 10500]|uniref:HTH CENPB-type domain-containing protein n=1 Tax=Talaromyces stipitatus (strain ATCC 10500 / CBS 375.48 / QM 6759 / NRRL 1006) TaxID=441959 RepID=B8M7C0_TALSN|nr:uncharacterized protein TSTA_035660 [Talaromyces stipitatus ATCC 10500]EED20340.1 conserved hypothetical protein [Talaromyces stipitatus ATCC 10500]